MFSWLVAYLEKEGLSLCSLRAGEVVRHCRVNVTLEANKRFDKDRPNHILHTT